MSKHTPAPWTVSELDARGEVSEYHIFIEPDVAVIERKVETRNEGRDMANARLIASAPQLLQALEEMLEVHGVRWEHVRGDSSIPASWVELSDKARAAIKAAKGEA